jgi:hypothetical protein
MKDITLDQVRRINDNMEDIHKTNPQVKEFKILETSENPKTNTIYMKSKAPMMSMREMLFTSVTKEISEG